MGSMKSGMIAAQRAGVKTAPMKLDPRGGRSVINPHADNVDRTSSARRPIVDAPPSVNESRMHRGRPNE